jgi:diguanylate cyclase (GGDEF)-like protein
MSYTSNTMSVAAGPHTISALPGTVMRVASGFALPLVVFALAHAAAPFAAHLPRSLQGLTTWGPLWALVLAGTLALVFNRSRVVFGVLCLGLAFAAHVTGLLAPSSGTIGRVAFAALCVAIPANLVALTLLRERGVFSFFGLRRASVLLLQVFVAVWAIVHQPVDLARWLYAPLLFDAPSLTSPIPQVALAVMAGAVVASVARAVAAGSALDAGLACALACFIMACQTLELPNHFQLFIGAGAAALVAAILQDTFRLAFRDELTGLPSRRALNERLLTLGARYTIAMVDVDHFKQFNDVYGHELGDHVLRMVAAKLRSVGGGGRAYRYGGEEFTLVFSGRRIPDAWPQLEALRERIGAHPMILRVPQPGLEDAAKLGSKGRDRQGIYVTVSIGVAERNARNATAGSVLRAADRALYRAKDRGRDRVSL